MADNRMRIGNSELCIRSISYVANSSQFLTEDEKVVDIHRNSDLLVYILDGFAEYTFYGEKHSVRSGDLVYIANGCDYDRHIISNNYHIICVDFLFDAPSGSMSSQVFPLMKNLDSYFKKLYRAWSTRGASFRLKSMSVLYEIYSRIVWNEANTYIPVEKRDVFETIIKKISENYMDSNLSVRSLAEMANMSEVHFRKIFKNIYKVSPQQYIIFLRVERAKELLVFDSVSVTAIGEILGFSDACHFSRVFKQKTGYTPFEYRKMFKEIK